MKLVVEWIRKKPVLAFYIICYAISWGLWLPLVLSRTDISELLAAIGVFGGPAITCIIVARVCSSPYQASRPVPFRLAFFGAWIACALVLTAYIHYTSEGSPPAALVVFAVLALIPAFVIASAVSGASGVQRTLSSLVRPKGWWGWYLLAVALPLALRLASVWLSGRLGWELMSDPRPPADPLKLAGSVLVIFLYTLLCAGGLNEETGWTGFALPRLLAKHNPLVSTIVVWILWMLWHVPLHLSGYFDLNMHVLVGSFFGRFLLTWLFIRSSGGLLTAMLLHTSVNVTSQFVPLTNASLPIGVLVALMVVIGGRMWRHLPQGSPAILAEESLAA